MLGLTTPDDAAVWKLTPDQAVVVTTDFFTPVVDDPYDYGAISAANSLSDIYAMGASPIFALNIAALPTNLPAEILSEIIRGAGEKAAEAGVVIAGGHTVQDKEPKFGLVVIGLVHPDKLLKKSAVVPGDHLILTKPLGVGVTTTAIKRGKSDPETILEVTTWMKKLNKKAGQLASELNLQAATDITGFSLLGHAFEMASSSNVALRFFSKQIPFLSKARKYGEAGYFAGGAADNRMFFKDHVHLSFAIDEVLEMLLFDPQTSGGLLISCPPEKLDLFKQKAQQEDQPFWIIGRAEEGQEIYVE